MGDRWEHAGLAEPAVTDAGPGADRTGSPRRIMIAHCGGVLAHHRETHLGFLAVLLNVTPT
jgi:hypothetical protein